MAGSSDEPRLDAVHATAWTIPTDTPEESDGTLRWDSTTMVLVEATGGGHTGVGYTYGHSSAVELIERKLAGLVEGSPALAVHRAWERMVAQVRNLGRPGLASTAISAIDVALWDLKARILGLPLSVLFDSYADGVRVYGSGGFTSYGDGELADQLSGWVDAGISAVKMKVGRDPSDDPRRVTRAREVVGTGVELMVDANGAYHRKQALALGGVFRDLGVTWYEEPVSSDDLEGLRLLRDQGPPGLEIAAGEYGFDPWYFRHMVTYGAVDVLQADATRCLGYTGFLSAAELCRSHSIEVSAHTAPQLHAHVCVSAPSVRHLEFFHDHARIEGIVFDGALEPDGGMLVPDRSRSGNGLVVKRADAERAAA